MKVKCLWFVGKCAGTWTTAESPTASVLTTPELLATGFDSGKIKVETEAFTDCGGEFYMSDSTIGFRHVDHSVTPVE
jgi:hypothetical protein